MVSGKMKITEPEPIPEDIPEEPGSRRPRNFPFIQQTLPTSYPVLNAGYIFPWFFFCSLCFMGFGVGIFLYAENIPEIKFNYTDCKSLEYPSLTCEQVLNGTGSRRDFRGLFPDSRNTREDDEVEDTRRCTCRLPFTLEEKMNGTVYMYYALTNFYQNHLRYYTNRDENQLKGNIGKVRTGDIHEPSSACKPAEIYAKDGNRTILPCGVQANSMFNDEIQIIDRNFENEKFVPLIRTGIAWGSDKMKFNNPENMTRNPKDPIWGKYFAKPKDWKKNLWELDSDPKNNAMENEDFMIWMRTSAFSNFRKLYRIIDGNCGAKCSTYEKGLPAGNYTFYIDYSYKANPFDGEKFIILTTSNMTAGRNYFLASAYGVTGVILFILFIIFLIIHILTRNRHLDFKMD